MKLGIRNLQLRNKLKSKLLVVDFYFPISDATERSK